MPSLAVGLIAIYYNKKYREHRVHGEILGQTQINTSRSYFFLIPYLSISSIRNVEIKMSTFTDRVKSLFSLISNINEEDSDDSSD